MRETMNELQIFNSVEFGTIRTVQMNNETWFVGKDIANALGYKNSTIALADNVDDEDKGVTKVSTLGGSQETVVINESGLYALVFGSRLEKAKALDRYHCIFHFPIVSAGVHVDRAPQAARYPHGKFHTCITGFPDDATAPGQRYTTVKNKCIAVLFPVFQGVAKLQHNTADPLVPHQKVGAVPDNGQRHFFFLCDTQYRTQIFSISRNYQHIRRPADMK